MKGCLPIPPDLLEETEVCPESPSGLRWRTTGPGRRPDRQAGCRRGEDYWRVGFAGADYLVHRVIWTHLHGEIPAGMVVDHRDGARGNNNPDNLQAITVAQNTQRRHTAGYSWHKGRGRWQASIRVDGKRRHLGYFDTEEEAAGAYLEAKRRRLGDVL